MTGLSRTTYTLYAGVYHAYAWQQGADGKVTEFRLPDFMWDGHEEVRFNLTDFMTVVADIDDEASIHYFKHYLKDGDNYLSMACTEDDSMDVMPNAVRENYHTASYYL